MNVHRLSSTQLIMSTRANDAEEFNMSDSIFIITLNV